MKRAAAIVLFLAAAGAVGAPCVPSSTRHCLNGGRFAVEVTWKDFQGNTGAGQAVALTSDTGYFWFFSSNNVELVVKVLDGRPLNSHFWVFYGALSNVEYRMTVTDSVTGSAKTYVNPSGNFGSVGDTAAFSADGIATASKPVWMDEDPRTLESRTLALRESLLEKKPDTAKTPAAELCASTATSLCLNGGRFRVGVTWKDFAGATGVGTAVGLTGDTGYFWFFSSNNVELTVKVLDARALNGNFWVFYGALSNVEYEITVTDTATSEVKTYRNTAGQFGSTGDTAAFPPVAAAPPSSQELIENDRKAGAITDEQALVYLVYVAWGSPSLPARYRSTVEPGIDLPIATQLAKRFPSLSPAAQSAIQPYLQPPLYKGSWGDPDFRSTLSSSVSMTSPRTAFDRTASICDAPAGGWAHKTTAHFNIWYRTVIPNGFTYTAAETEAAASNVAAVADHVFDMLTGLFHVVPISDVNEACNGGDGALDVYMDRMAFGAVAQTVPYLPGCMVRPAWMWINPGTISDPTVARDVFAHEFMHMIQLAYSRGSSCDDYAWLDEAAGNWAIDYVYSTDQYEQTGPNNSYAPCYYQIDFGDPIEKTERFGCNGYSDYVFLFYLSHKLGPDTIKSIYEYGQLFDPFDSLDNATASAGGLKTVWPNFVTAGWNDWQGGIADEFSKWDSLHEGVKKYVDQRDQSTRIDLKGAPDKTFDLAGDFLVPGSDDSITIEPLGARYVDLKFPDDSARYVVVHNKPADLAAEHPHLHIRALMKIDGQWKPEEDWTNKPLKTFCRDARAERLEELVLMYSNSDPGRSAPASDGREPNRIFLEDLDRTRHSPTVEVSNIGCWRWIGNATVTTKSPDGFTTVESATATFDRFRFPGTNPEDTVGFDAFKSDNTGTATFSIDGPLGASGCTISGSGSGPLQGDGGLIADGGFILTFLAAGQPTDRTAIGSGSTNVPGVKKTTTCPNAPPEISTDAEDVHWLELPDEGWPVSDDGQTIAGRWQRTDDDGDKVSVWAFHSVREE